ncbi:apolipoprotein N-acyltransferase [Pseudomonadota bacterium]
MPNKQSHRIIWALISGALLPLAFAPFFFYPVAFLSLALLFLLWLDRSKKNSFWIGFAYGFSHFMIGVSWVYVSLNTYGHMPPVLAAVSVLLFVSLLAMFPAMVGVFQAWLRQADTPWSRFFQVVLVMPVLWVSVEWVRSWIFTGFPWLSLGYSQVGHQLESLAPWIGVYGVGFFVAILAALLASLFRCGQKIIRTLALFSICAVFFLSWAAGEVKWATASGDPLRVALVQGNIGLADKWDPAKRDDILGSYLSLSEQHQDYDLIIWPEASLPIYIDQLSELFLTRLRQHPADFVFGALDRQLVDGNSRIYNSAVGIEKVGSAQIYRKSHLVPFGEFLPFEFALKGLLRYLRIPMSDFSSWDSDQPPFQLSDHKVGLSICYEDAFPMDVSRSLPEADLLANISEDAWFGDSLAPHQRLQIAQMRSLETARPMLRAANTGISAVIDHRGKVVKQSPQFQRLVLSAQVQPTQGITPFVRYGNGPILLLMAALLVLGVILSRLSVDGVRKSS